MTVSSLLATEIHSMLHIEANTNWQVMLAKKSFMWCHPGLIRSFTKQVIHTFFIQATTMGNQWWGGELKILPHRKPSAQTQSWVFKTENFFLTFVDQLELTFLDSSFFFLLLPSCLAVRASGLNGETTDWPGVKELWSGPWQLSPISLLNMLVWLSLSIFTWPCGLRMGDKWQKVGLKAHIIALTASLIRE